MIVFDKNDTCNGQYLGRLCLYGNDIIYLFTKYNHEALAKEIPTRLYKHFASLDILGYVSATDPDSCVEDLPLAITIKDKYEYNFVKLLQSEIKEGHLLCKQQLIQLDINDINYFLANVKEDTLEATYLINEYIRYLKVLKEEEKQSEYDKDSLEWKASQSFIDYSLFNKFIDCDGYETIITDSKVFELPKDKKSPTRKKARK